MGLAMAYWITPYCGHLIAGISIMWRFKKNLLYIMWKYNLPYGFICPKLIRNIQLLIHGSIFFFCSVASSWMADCRLLWLLFVTTFTLSFRGSPPDRIRHFCQLGGRKVGTESTCIAEKRLYKTKPLWESGSVELVFTQRFKNVFTLSVVW